MEACLIDSVVCGYHVIKIYGQPQSKDCYTDKQRERFNPSDQYAVAMLHDGVVVGHAKKYFSDLLLTFHIKQEELGSGSSHFDVTSFHLNYLNKAML